MELNKQDLELIKIAKSLAVTREVPGGLIGEVGSVLITKKGKIFSGISLGLCCGLGFCAEHSAIANMLSQSDETDIKTIVACSNSKTKPIMYPCGRCRELMNVIDKNNWENTEVIIEGDNKIKLKELLPNNWLIKEGGKR